MNPFDVLVQPRLTEKTVHLQNKLDTYTFEVHPSATKIQIKDAIERIYKVKVKKINTANVAGKTRRNRLGTGVTAAWKKAYVVLKDGEALEGI
jgi:large subunit ribosomal protein L23